MIAGLFSLCLYFASLSKKSRASIKNGLNIDAPLLHSKRRHCSGEAHKIMFNYLVIAIFACVVALVGFELVSESRDSHKELDDKEHSHSQ